VHKNHEARKLQFDHDFVVDLRYIRRRETACLVNGLARPAWISFALWALKRGLKTQLRESMSSDSKYVTVTIREWRRRIEPTGPQRKSKDRTYIIRFSDHPWIDRGVFKKPDYEVGLKGSTLAEIIGALDKIADDFKLKIELGPQNKDGHHCELEMSRAMDNGKMKYFVFCRVCNKRSHITNLESGAHTSWKNGARFPLDVPCKSR
jgi:hypothetical protein